MHEIGTSFTLQPSKIGWSPVSALAPKPGCRSRRSCTTARRIIFRLFVTSRMCRQDKTTAIEVNDPLQQRTDVRFFVPTGNYHRNGAAQRFVREQGYSWRFL